MPRRALQPAVSTGEVIREVNAISDVIAKSGGNFLPAVAKDGKLARRHPPQGDIVKGGIRERFAELLRRHAASAPS